MIHFNVPPFIGTELEYMREAIANHKICGDGNFTKKCSAWLEEKFKTRRALLTTSGSSALDMAALLCNIRPGDEVILPSFTFSSTANAFILAGAQLVFVDIRADTMNLDETKIEAAITDKTRVICPVHYAGVACEMDSIVHLAGEYKLQIVEDAAQGVMSSYKGKALGTIGDFGCCSFHETKNYSMGEGGAILINRTEAIERAEILREKGTNRAKYFRGEIAKYCWVDFGDSYLPSDLNAAYLWAQLECADKINENRLNTWIAYWEALQPYARQGKIELPHIPEGCVHNAHMFYVKFPDLSTRQSFIQYMKDNEILCTFHYVPLHSAPAGRKFGRFHGEDVHTTAESDRLVRLPMYYGIVDTDLEKVIEKTCKFIKRM